MNRRPRLLLLTDAFDDRGGGEIVVGHLARALRDWDVGILATTRGRNHAVDEGGLRVFRVHSSYHPRLRPIVSLLNPWVTPSVGSIVRRFRPDVVHAWNVHSHLSYDALRIVRRTGVPVVLTYQDAQPFCYSKYKCWLDRSRPCPTDPDYRADPRTCRSCRQHYLLFPPRNRLARAYLSRFVSAGVSVSNALARALEQNRIPVARVVYNGVPLQEPALAEALAARQPEPDGHDAERHPVLLTGGRLHYFKGQGQAVAALGRIAAEVPQARLVVLGDRGEYRDRLAAEAVDCGVESRVRFPGFLDRAAYYRHLAAADLFLNLSMYLDPFPTVNLEAMALRVPVVGTCYGGTPEAVVDGQTGYIVDPYNLEAVSYRAVSLLNNGRRRAQLGQAGRRRVEQYFTVERMADQYRAIYSSLIGGR